MGILASVIANANRDPDKTDEFTAEQFMPKFEEEEVETEDPLPQTDPQDVARMVDLYFSALAAARPDPHPALPQMLEDHQYLGKGENDV